MRSTMPMHIGARFGWYEILSPLGSGGMGEVYRARDTKLKREVAIKVLSDGLSEDAERLARFQREAEILATLNHSNIAAVYGLEKDNGITGIVLELVDGETLSDILARGLLPVADALPIARQIADALECAHEKGVIHRDLKPANIKVTPEGKGKGSRFRPGKNPGTRCSDSVSERLADSDERQPHKRRCDLRHCGVHEP
jgi:serine/threonine protein kinase